MAMLRVCFEIDGIAEDENGLPCKAGVQFSWESDNDVSYDTRANHMIVPVIASLLCVPVSALHVITPEEYDERYGDAECQTEKS